jgi:hypothetical protein
MTHGRPDRLHVATVDASDHLVLAAHLEDR